MLAEENGYLIELAITRPIPDWRRTKLYWKFGIPKTLREWLLENVGECCPSHVQWEQGHRGDWFHSGCVTRNYTERGGGTFFARMFFRDKNKAMLYKLAWSGQL